MKRLSIVVLSGLISVTANAANWTVVGASAYSNGDIQDIHSVDTESISTSGRYRTAFIKQEYGEYAFIPGFPSGYNSLTAFSMFDCQSNPIRSKAITAVLKKDREFVYATDRESRWSVAFPDSVGEKVSKFVCSYKK